jgi:CubicO group peptidase (beta-lactamase class C family)
MRSSPRLGKILLMAGLGILVLWGYRFSGLAGKNENLVWQTASLESQGMDSSKLDALRHSLESRRTKAFLVLKHGRIVYEWYAPGHGPNRRHYTASLAKSLVGGMSLLVALVDRRIALDDPAWKYIPAWQHDPFKSKITIRHLVTHSSGIHDAEESGKSHEELDGWKGAFWQSRGRISRILGRIGVKTTPSSSTPDPFSIALHNTPVLFDSGTRYMYSGPGFAALGYAITASLRNGPHKDIRILLNERIMKAIGIPESEWSIGYGQVFNVDEMRLYPIWSGGSYTARAVARVGQFMLQKGQWQGRQLVARAWVEKMVSYAGTPIPERTTGTSAPAQGLCWSVNFDGVLSSVPNDTFLGTPGAGHQVLLVIPSLDLVVVRFGERLEDKGENFWAALEKYLLNPVVLAAY